MLVVNALSHIENHFSVLNELKQEVPFKLWPRQRDAYELMISALRIIYLKSRQSGFSTMTGAHALTQSMYQPRFTALILSVTSDDSEAYLDRLKSLYDSQSDEVKELFPISRPNTSEIEFKNGSKIVSLPASRGYGLTADLIVIDEFFKINRTRSRISITKVLEQVTPALDKLRGQLICVGTAEGMNQQHQIYVKSKAGLTSFKPLFFSCWDDPNMTEEKRLQKIADSPDSDGGEKSINQEYPRNDTEAFVSSGTPRFSTDALSQYTETSLKLEFRGNIEADGTVVPDKNGPIRFYRAKSPIGQYLISADVAEGLEHGDYSCAVVLDRETGDIMAEWHGHIEHADLGTVLSIMGRHWNNAIIAIETGCSAHGTSAMTQLRNVEKYPTTIIHQSKHDRPQTDDKFMRPERRYGWFTTSITKPLIVNYLASLIQDLLVPGFSDEQISELSTFVRNQNGSTTALPGFYDDRVMALAIGFYLLQFYPPKKYGINDGCESCLFQKTVEGDSRCLYSGKYIKDPICCSAYRYRPLGVEQVAHKMQKTTKMK